MLRIVPVLLLLLAMVIVCLSNIREVGMKTRDFLVGITISFLLGGLLFPIAKLPAQAQQQPKDEGAGSIDGSSSDPGGTTPAGRTTTTPVTPQVTTEQLSNTINEITESLQEEAAPPETEEEVAPPETEEEAEPETTEEEEEEEEEVEGAEPEPPEEEEEMQEEEEAIPGLW